MPKKLNYNINLLPKDPFFETSAGRVLNWSLNAGRYIVIFTEIIVIFSFASRFVLDRQVTDLNESIYQKQLIIQSQEQFESDFRLAQTKLQSYQQISQQDNLIEVFPHFQEVVPSDLRLEKLSIRQDLVTGEALALSNNSLNTFIGNLQLSPNFQDIVINRIEARDEKRTGFIVQFSARYQI